MSYEEEAMLESDFKVFMSGHGPPTVQLARAPMLDRWETVVGRDIRGARCMTVAGDVTGHDAISDGTRFETGAMVWMDRDFKWVRTVDGFYRLGDRAIPIDGVDL